MMMMMMMMMMQKSPSLLAFAAVAAAGSCPSDLPLSCHNTTAVQDTCCFMPAGQLLQTQFWDSDPATGPSDSWTIHGLWPDNCDGTYPTKCDPSRAYAHNLTQILSAAAGGNDNNNTLAYMTRYWKDYKGDDAGLWAHEWSKHGTCVSTLAPACYDTGTGTGTGTGYRSGEEAVDFFARVVALFQTLPTYAWLAEAGIVPDDDRTYDVERIQDVLAGKHGARVTLGCKSGGGGGGGRKKGSGEVLNEVWYHFNVHGSLQTGQFVAAEPNGARNKCRGKVRYRPKVKKNY